IGYNAASKHTWVVLASIVLWIWLAIPRRLREANRATPLVSLLLAWCALHVLVGRQGVYVHEWWWWPLTAGAVMAAGIVLDHLLNLLQASGIPRLEINIFAVIVLLVFGTVNYRESR